MDLRIGTVPVNDMKQLNLGGIRQMVKHHKMKLGLLLQPPGLTITVGDFVETRKCIKSNPLVSALLLKPLPPKTLETHYTA